MQFEEIHTERLRLRKLTPKIYDYIHAHFPDDALMDFLGLKSAGELEKEKTKYAHGLKTYNRTFANFQMIDRETGQLIGACGFHTVYPEHSRAEIGYAIVDEDFKRKGLMGEALEAIVEYGFKNMHLNRIEAMVGPSNVASLRLIEKMGFVREGLLRKHYCKNGTPEDSIIFSLLKDEYRDARK